jgi:LacI family transcriptional regulator
LGKARIDEVAKVAGVSKTTVSHALTGSRPVSPAARAKVEAAVETLGYRANSLARGLRTQRSLTIALVIPDITNPFYPMVARGVQDAMGDAGYQVVLCSTDADPARESAYIEDMIARSVDGLILGQLSASLDSFSELVERRIAVVTLGPKPPLDIGDQVMGDNRVATTEATAHLLRAGRTRIAFAGAGNETGPAAERLAGYQDALLSAGLTLDPALAVGSGYDRATGSMSVEQLLDAGVAFDGLVCVNDLSAIGALDALRQREVSVPQDVGVVGFDDIDAAELVRPRLTTVDNRAYEKGTVCGRLLVQRLSGDLTGPSRSIVVPGRLVIRESA